MGKIISHPSRSAEDKYLASLESKPAELPGCMATGCLEDADLEMSLDDVLLCSLHWGRVGNLPSIKERWAVLAAREEHIKTHDAAQDAIKSGTMRSVVYYVRFDRHIKIGTAVDLRHRMKSLSLHPDSLLAVEPGNRLVEHQRHVMFADERYARSELFEPSERLLEHIEYVKSLFGDPRSFLPN